MDEDAPAPPRRRRRVLRAIGLLIGGLIAALAIGILGIDTGPGHRLITDRIAALKPASGLRIRIGRIDGSLWNHAVLRDVRLYDPRGQFFEAPEIRLDWHPAAWTRNRLDIDRLASDLVVLDRLPALRKTSGGPILPGFDIRIGALSITRLQLGKAVAGRPFVARVAAKAEIHDRRAMIQLHSLSSAGDRLTIDLDAEPDGDRFRLGGSAIGPAGGAIGGMLGSRRPVTLAVGGRGTWHRWDGTAKATMAERTVADLTLGVRDGRYLLAGTLAPSPFLAGKLQRLSAPAVRVDGQASLADRKLTGHLALASPALLLAANGTIDLAESRFAGVTIDSRLLRPKALFPNMTGRDVRLTVRLDGPFRTAAYRYAVSSPHVAFDTTGLDGVRATGEGRLSPLPIALPIRFRATQITGLGDVAGGILRNIAVAGTLRIDARTLAGSGLALTSDKLKGKLGLRLDLVSGRYDIAVTGGLARYLIPGLGIVDVTSEVSVVPGPRGIGTVVAGRGHAIVRRFDNAFLRSLAGGLPRIDTRLVRGPDGVLHFSDLVLTGPAARITGTGLRRRDGTFRFEGRGTQASYGPFRIALDGDISHPKVALLLDRPVDALGLTQVALDLDPVAQGFAYRAAGGSTLGRFTSSGRINTPANAPTTIDVAALDVSGTHGQGSLRSDPNGFTGRIDLSGGGIGGALLFAPAGTIQRIDPHLVFTGATLAASPAIVIGRGKADGTILLDPAGVTIRGTASGQGIRRAGLSIARVTAGVDLRGGRGRVTASIAGSRGRAFDLQGAADLAPGRIAITGQGSVDRRPIGLSGPAILTAQGDAWLLAPTQLRYAGGVATVSGRFGASATSFAAGLDRMPLAVLDILQPGMGLGGYASGRFDYRQAAGAAPAGSANLTIRGLTRAGLVLSSQPVDVGLTGILSATGAVARAVVASGGRTIGRAQARIGPLGPGGDIVGRLRAAPLFAQVRYVGPGDTLWRLVGIETIDLSGPIAVAADIGGTPADPAIRGSLRTDNGRLESAVTGTIISGIKASGRFGGSRLTIDQLSGRAGGGTVSGRARFDLGAGKGLGMDIALQADNAVLLNRDDIGATVTGPLTIRSDGAGGTIAGDVKLTKSRFRLGRAAAAQVPLLPVKEINQADTAGGDFAPPAPWLLDIKADARNRLIVSGLGLDSEWRARLTIKGQVDNPAIGGRADLVRGGYEFAGRRFDLERGIIRFTGDAPANPVLDIAAQANLNGINATIAVLGTGLQPQIAFSSVPALPEDELLSRLLFGTSITNLSAPEALQLAAAVASLRSSGGGGGLNLDPINAVRKAVRLDRLRILPADVTTGQKTSVAAGKYIGRRTYVELVTDGAGYSATSIEYRITRWLSVLSTISTIGRQSANVRVSKDY